MTIPPAYQAYFAETDADRRKALLDEIEAKEADDALLPLCRTLWKLRYVDPKSGRRVDLFLWEILNLICLYRTAGWMKKSARKEAARALEALGVSLAAPYGEAGEAVLSAELANAVRLYLSTCDSKSYRKRLMGLSEMKTEDWQYKVAGDIWRLSEGLPEKLDMKEAFALPGRVAREEFCKAFENGETLLKERRHAKKG